MRHLGRFGSAPVLRLRTAFILATLVSSGGVLISATGAAAGPAFEETTPFTYPGTNMCTGEMFTGTGTLHFLMSENLSASGNLQSKLDTHIDGLQATTVTGKKYVVQDVFDHSFVFAGADEDNFDITAHFIRVGEDGTFILGDDFYFRIHTHVTATDSAVTAYQVQTTDEPCQ